ncbi:uncharacterized protein LOC106754523 [Vigna radiata var. radiata]|uniref:Uncharacterized protein LOC106754523 n=1 Tax=Vigna radiata var. radiata TaxID=3916 RepID=A0A1S3TE51_VIGRR|nr:uncharacterized protein LOC106754523 [Vigna radiata var. radiata]
MGEHLVHVEMVLSTLENKWVANRKKCGFGQTGIKYLSHTISDKGVEMDSEKVKAVMKWGRPKTVKGLRGFWGFVRDYRKIVKSLTELLKKGEFLWNEKIEEAWQSLKQAITTAPVLSVPEFQQPFQIECDA